jgi:hypothetical protein
VPGARGWFWAGFVAGHALLGLIGLRLRPESVYDLELYRLWVRAGLDSGAWPVLDHAWVYPAGALLPMLAVAPAAASYAAFSAAWFLLVAALNALGAVVLVRSSRHGLTGAWWWLAATVALGPVALGRLDGVVVPLVVVALALASRRPGAAAALLTLGAWIKVAPGAIVVALMATARHPWRRVALPAAGLSLAIGGAALAAGSGLRVLSFLGAQQSRGLQVESVAATPFSLARLWVPEIYAELDVGLNTYEIGGAPAAGLVAALLDVALVATVAAIAWLTWRAARAPGPGALGREADVLLVAAFAAELALIVTNKVGSPQFMSWLLAPVAVALARSGWSGPWRLPAVGVLVTAGLTQWVFPWAYWAFLSASGPVVVVAAARNLLLVALLVWSVVALARRRAPEPLLR